MELHWQPIISQPKRAHRIQSKRLVIPALAWLELKAGDTALHLVRVRGREGLNFGYYMSWTVGVKKPKNQKLFETIPRLTYFRDNGLEVTHVTQTISACAASSESALALNVPE